MEKYKYRIDYECSTPQNHSFLPRQCFCTTLTAVKEVVVDLLTEEERFPGLNINRKVTVINLDRSA